MCMPLTRSEKERVVIDLAESFRRSASTILVDFSGMTVSEVTRFRNALKNVGCKVKVARNKLILRGFNQAFNDGSVPAAEVERFIANLRDSTMVIFAMQDPISPIKEIYNLHKELKEKFKIKASFFEKRTAVGKEVEALKELPSRDECLGMLLSLIQAPIQKLLATIKEPSRQVVAVLDAIAKKGES